jgi:hypothetical protein
MGIPKLQLGNYPLSPVLQLLAFFLAVFVTFFVSFFSGFLVAVV